MTTATKTVEAIAAMDDPVLRNLWITQRYHEFAVQLRDAGLGEDASWCAFAVWASKTAGETIRGNVLTARAGLLVADCQEALHHGVGGLVGRHLTHGHLGRAIGGVVDDVSAQMARGNLMVFTELAPLFTALIDAQRSSPSSPEALLTALAPALEPLASGDDAAPVVTAFGCYARALFAPADRAALVLQANTLAVAHEQRRLQDPIESALNAAISDTLKEVIETQIVGHLPIAAARHQLDHAIDEVCGVLDAAWDTVLTECVMQLVTACETFDLRRDVPPLESGMFPAALCDLTGNPAGEAVAQWDRTKGTGTPSGARDWAKLTERMNFIVNLFRSRQQDANLFSPPFSEDQLAVLARGRLPPEPL